MKVSECSIYCIYHNLGSGIISTLYYDVVMQGKFWVILNKQEKIIIIPVTQHFLVGILLLLLWWKLYRLFQWFIVTERKIEYKINVTSISMRITLFCFKFLKCSCDCNKGICLWGEGGEAVLHEGHLECVFLQAYATKYRYSVIWLHIYNKQAGIILLSCFNVNHFDSC